MLASTHFHIVRGPADDWFDAILNADTKLFIDPFLVFKENAAPWVNTHDTIIRHFERAFLLIAESNNNRESLAYQKALRLLTFTEPKELCLGYTAKGTRGAGGGLGYAKVIGQAIVNAIARGLTHPRHFEELGILNEGIGSDRISDITATILKPNLIGYTQAIAARHNIPLEPRRIYAGGFNVERLRWEDTEIAVPINPFNDQPFLFVPQRFLSSLPTLNADDWFDSYQNQQLRQDINYEIVTKVDKATIVAKAREHPEAVRAWIESKEEEAAQPYDLNKDPDGVWQWDRLAMQFTDTHRIRLRAVNRVDAFLRVIQRLLDQFQLYIEEQGGWKLLWNDDETEKPEEAAQLLFRGIVQYYCQANNIVIDREVEIGRGPVDFKFSNGYSRRALLEIKKLHNGKFWNGLEAQLPTYMRGDNAQHGFFLAVRYRDGRSADQRARELPARVRRAARQQRLSLQFKLVDARKPLSASNI